MFHGGPTVMISIAPIQFVHCSSAGLLHELCAMLRELRVVFVKADL